MIRRVLGFGLAALVMVVMLGCATSKDRTHEALQPAGEPNPEMKVASPSGTGGPGGGAEATATGETQ